MTLRSLKVIVYSENGGHLNKMAAILDFQVAHRADLTSSPKEHSCQMWCLYNNLHDWSHYMPH